MKKFKLVFDEGTGNLQIYYTNEFLDQDDFISFYDEEKKVEITYNKRYLVKKVEMKGK